MKEELLKKLLEWAEGLGDLAAAELPLVAQEIVTYGFYSGILTIVFGLFGLIVCLLLVRTANKNLHVDDREGLIVFLSICAFFSFIFSVGMIADGVKRVTLTSTAPRLYIIEYLRR